VRHDSRCPGVVSSNGVCTVLRTAFYGILRCFTVPYGVLRCRAVLGLFVGPCVVPCLYAAGSVLDVRGAPLWTSTCPAPRAVLFNLEPGVVDSVNLSRII
jgi:hypothetical protein